MYAPVVVFAYNRPKHLRAMLRCLNESPLASQSMLIIFCDGPRSVIDATQVAATREVVNDFASIANFKDVLVFPNRENEGLANSVIANVTAVLELFGSAIVVEDDLLTARSFLEYANQALEHYRLDNRIWSISGYTPNLTCDCLANHDVYYSKRGCSWGWATWADRWRQVDWSVGSYGSFKNNFFARRKFGQWGPDMPAMLDAQMLGVIDSWAIRWCYEQFRCDMYTVYPARSLVRNIGTDGSGTHGVIANDFDVEIHELQDKFHFDQFYENEDLRIEFCSKYQSSSVALLRQEGIWALKRAKAGVARLLR